MIAILGWVLVGGGLLALVVEPLVIGRLAESSPGLRANKRLIVGCLLFTNLCFVVLGVVILVYGAQWLGP